MPDWDEMKSEFAIRFSFSEINIAIEKMRLGEIMGRCLIDFNMK